MGYNIVLQLLVSGFLTVILLLHFLSLVKIWTTVALIKMEQKKLMVTKEYRNKEGFSQWRKIQVLFRIKNP